MSLIKNKVNNSNTQTQIQLLTFAPQNCSRESLIKYFEVSDHVVRESRELFKKNGLLGEVTPKRGNNILRKHVHCIIIGQKYIYKE